MNGLLPARTKVKARRTPQQGRSKEKIELILDIASRMLAEKGLDGTTMKGISGEAKCTISALYQYFDSKSAIVLELVQRVSKKRRAEFERLVGDIENETDVLPLVFHMLDNCAKQRRNNTEIQYLISAANATPEIACVVHAELEYLAVKFAHGTARFVDEALVDHYTTQVVYFFVSAEAVLGALPNMGRDDGSELVESLKARIACVYEEYMGTTPRPINAGKNEALEHSSLEEPTPLGRRDLPSSSFHTPQPHQIATGSFRELVLQMSTIIAELRDRLDEKQEHTANFTRRK